MKRLPSGGKGQGLLTETALISFALGILVTFFLSARILVVGEALLLIAAGMGFVCKNGR